MFHVLAPFAPIAQGICQAARALPAVRNAGYRRTVPHVAPAAAGKARLRISRAELPAKPLETVVGSSLHRRVAERRGRAFASSEPLSVFPVRRKNPQKPPWGPGAPSASAAHPVFRPGPAHFGSTAVRPRSSAGNAPLVVLFRRAVSVACLAVCAGFIRKARARMSGTDAGNLRRPVCPGQRTRLDFFSIGIRNRFFTPPRTPALGEASCRQKQGPSPVGLVPPPNPEAVPVLAGRRPKAAWDRRCGAVVTRPLFPFARHPIVAPLFPETQCLADATASGFGLDFRLLRGFFTGCRAARGCGFCAFLLDHCFQCCLSIPRLGERERVP